MTKEQAIQKAIEAARKGREATFSDVEGLNIFTAGSDTDEVLIARHGSGELVERIKFDPLTGERQEAE